MHAYQGCGVWAAGAGTFCPEPEPLEHFARSRSRDSFPEAEPEPFQICTAPHPRSRHILLGAGANLYGSVGIPDTGTYRELYLLNSRHSPQSVKILRAQIYGNLYPFLFNVRHILVTRSGWQKFPAR